MAGKLKTRYVCAQCGYETAKWYGKCPECGAWNSFSEEVRSETTATAKSIAKAMDLSQAVQPLDAVDSAEEQRYHTGLSEFDRVLGGGIVLGSVVLISGDPGIGKSTLLMQVSGVLGQNKKVLYVSGEESARQIKLRANRLGVEGEGLFVSTATDIEHIIELANRMEPDVLVVDSIQTVTHSAVSSSAGSITQVRECTQLLISYAKNSGKPVFIVGHVNKDGAIAGPKVLEHMVDAVLYFEGDKQLSYRILRAVKNRFGSTNEIGVFSMDERGLEAVENPSEMLLSGRPEQVSGTCIVCVMEGSRPILVEVQALVAKSSFGQPRRMAAGFDYNRTALLLAVLEKRAGCFFGNTDVYVNIVGGLRLDEPAVDLAVALALVSNLTDRPLPEHLVAFGEIGLAGEIRNISAVESRVRECYRLGYQKIMLPKAAIRQLHTEQMPGLQLFGVSTLAQALAVIDKGIAAD